MWANSLMFRRHPSNSAVRATPVRRRPAVMFSATGIVYIVLMLFMGIAAINSQANLLFGLFGLMVGVLLVSGVISRIVLRGLTLNRGLPEHACVGEAITVSYQLSNTKRFWPSLSVVLAELDGVEAFSKQPQCFLLHAAAGMTASVPVLLVPKRRGIHALDRFQLITGFPFGFVKRAVTGRHKESLVIYPPLAQVSPALLAMCRSADSSGGVSRPQPGGADEFYGVKEYRPGDNPRWIYWRRSARSGTLVSKEMTRVAPPRILLLVDTMVRERLLQEHSLVERGIAMAASLAAVALEQGLSVGLCAWAGKWASILPSRGKRHKSDLLTLLARLPLNTEHGLADLVDQARPLLRMATTPVLLTPAEDRLSGGDLRRHGLILISSDSPRAKNWFKFGPKIDFMTSMPAEQQPTIHLS
jgi:uncharacterized protein (DUF58 family)